MPKFQLITNCEGPLALNDNAFELCRDFIKPQGDRFFQQVKRYDNYLAEIAKMPEYKAGNLLKLLAPFLKACGLTNSRIDDYSRQTVMLMPGAEDAFRFLSTRNLSILAFSTSYRPFAEAVGLTLGLEQEHIFGTKLDLDCCHLPKAEAEELLRLVDEINNLPEIEMSASAASITDLSGSVQEAVATLDRIFGEQLPAMEVGAILQDVTPFSGPERAEALAVSLAKSGLKMADIIYVGNSLSDVQALESVRAGGGLAISFNGNRSAVGAAEVVVVSDSAWSIALLTAIAQSWGKEGVLEVAAPETRDKSRALVLPEEVIEPVFSGLNGHLLNIYLSKGIDRDKLAKESLAMQAKLRAEAIAALEEA